jgi:hypothetical protein
MLALWRGISISVPKARLDPLETSPDTGVQDKETISDIDLGRKELEVDSKVGKYLETSRHHRSE